VVNGGASSGLTGESLRTTKGNSSLFRKVQQAIITSRNSGDLVDQEREERSSSDREGKMPDWCENVGGGKSGFQCYGDLSQNSNINVGEQVREKNVYVGQRDTIREKMVWETLERDSDVADLGGKLWELDHMDSTKSTHVRKSHEKGISTSGGGMLHGNNPLQTPTRGPHTKQRGRVTRSTKNIRNGNGNEDLKGKRKVEGA
jgi:hypothetical protein